MGFDYRTPVFRMKLNSNKPPEFGDLHNFHQFGFRINTYRFHAGIFKIVEEFIVEFVTVTVALADDFLAVIRAHIDQAGSDSSELIRIDNRLEMDLVQHRVLSDDNPVSIGPTEFKLLHFFMTHQERVYSRAQLLDLVWGRNVYIEERTVDVHIRRLRRALEPHGMENLVQTVRGVGYKLIPPAV